MKRLEVKYNTQCDNFEFSRLKPSAQCGYTSACMVLSYYIPLAGNDIFIGEFINYIDRDFISGKSQNRMGASLNNYTKVLNNYLKENKVKKEAKIRVTGGTEKEIKSILDGGSPLMASTMLTTSGHYICIVGYDDDGNWIVHDPYGLFNFKSNNYVKIGGNSGEGVKYPIDKMTVVMNRSGQVATGKPGFRYLWIE
jgi:hypothetical protein